MPQYLWFATGGKSQLSQEKLSVLAGRKTIAFPDIDGYEEWKKKLSAAEIDIAVSDILQRYATEEQRKAHIDIADLLIQWKQNGELIPGTPQRILTRGPQPDQRLRPHSGHRRMAHLNCPAVSPLGQRDRRDTRDKISL